MDAALDGGADGHVDAAADDARADAAPPIGCAGDTDRDGIVDRIEGTSDADGDGLPNDQDIDADGDGILDADESGHAPDACDTAPVDTDGDSLPDYLDLDSDGDTIADAMEWNAALPDQDVDGVWNERDLDSDGDGLYDADEAGDADLATPPRSCPNEWNPLTRSPFYPGTPPVPYPGDGVPDYLDVDSDNDSLPDGLELRLGLDPCNPDTDADGIDDGIEGTYVAYVCPDGMTPLPGIPAAACTIARGGGAPPADVIVAVLPYTAPPQVFTRDVGTSVRAADVFFLVDTTSTMGPVLATLQATAAVAGGIVDGVRAAVPDVQFGAGAQQDFPFGTYGAATDVPLTLASRETSSAVALGTALSTLAIGDGGDAPGAQTYALWEATTGLASTWSYAGPTTYVEPGGSATCTRGVGAACFRADALPLLVHFSDHCAHSGPPGEDPACDSYAGISGTTPLPTWTDLVAVLQARGARYVGLDTAPGDACSAPTAAGGSGPCYFMRRTAEETGTLVAGEPIVVPLSPTADAATFTSTVVGAIGDALTRVPLDVDTALRAPATSSGIDATRFVVRRSPACNDHAPVDTACWTEPAGTTHAAAVRSIDTSTFFGVVPGTRVTFDITLQNDVFRGPPSGETFVVFVDIRAGGAAVLETLTVLVVVPYYEDPGWP